MGNYHKIERDFIERTMKLIAQYEGDLDKYDFKEQFNYTLIINCLLGLIIMPKQRVISYIPKDRLTEDFKKQIGLNQSWIDNEIKTLRELVKRLRNPTAHFDIDVISEDDENRIDWIEFKDDKDGGRSIAKFRASEILPFLNYYSACLMENIDKYR